MDFLKKFISARTREPSPERPASSFADLSDDQLETHLKITRYGSFVLTDAVRPSYDLQVVPRTGFRHDTYNDTETAIAIPVLMVSVSRDEVLDLFVDLLDPLGGEVDVVLETSHHSQGNGHDDYYRESIELPILKSVLYDFEEMLVNDGCTGIAVLNPKLPMEVQFDEHKIFTLYGQELHEFEQVLETHSVPCCEDIKFITEAEHVHSSTDTFAELFEQLRFRLGIDN
ncbi:MAG: hypothetical protein CMJ65_01000 [Planctomycetaceae bacterium]|jgi:hypothetical protein|nr:hypothetical protein [Planctomycetaceae bacterium]MDP7275573.1 hypothetical protein [Planctomycetaceae bacterium]